ncbi:MFS transporter [Saccharospirillum impatiens]|uniref:MFS transporter n=1 Tax=Saccharospirillum impatiens TaxID=169438 RepID=UPI000414E95F|nr:MFS transporter [Saccharospirillum impatiens]
MTDRRRMILICLCFIAFISLGLPDGLLGVAWPGIRADFNQPLDAVGWLLVATTTGYMISSFFSGAVSRFFGIGLLLAFSCIATGVALLGFTLVPVWLGFVVLGTLVGLGAGAIDAGLNTYVAEHYSERLMQWLHASFGIGITLGPLIMTLMLNLTGQWSPGYWLVGCAQVFLGLCFFVSARLWEAPVSANAEPTLTDDAGKVAQTHPGPPTNAQPGKAPASFVSSLTTPAVWLSMGLFFAYTGLELTLGLWGYSLLTESREVEASAAGLWIAIYWGMFTLGRMVAGVFANRMGNHRLVTGSLILALAGTVLLAWNPIAWVGLIAIGLVGFAFAPIFPGLVSGTRLRVGEAHLANTMGMQIAAAGIGAACLPALAGVLAEQTSLEIVPGFLIVFIAVLGVLYGASRRLGNRQIGIDPVDH